jgi:Rad3-related DNA helicase
LIDQTVKSEAACGTGRMRTAIVAIAHYKRHDKTQL